MSRTKFTHADDVFRGLLKELRLKRDITQTEVAKRLGTPQSYVSKYESGERRLDFVETAQVCKALEISLERFAKMFVARVAKG